jgi:hypothetical protein
VCKRMAKLVTESVDSCHAMCVNVILLLNVVVLYKSDYFRSHKLREGQDRMKALKSVFRDPLV